MKLSIVLSTQPASFTALAYKGELGKNLAKIKDLGYDGVELAVRDPALLDVRELETSLQHCQLPVPAIGTGQPYGEEGLSLSDRRQAIREKAIERIQDQFKLAERLQALVIVGLIRGGQIPASEFEAAEARLLESLQACLSDTAATRLVIEPINRYETSLLNTVGAALCFLDRLKDDRVGLLLDTFHMNIEEPSLSESIKLAGDRIYHFHLADSNRRHPGAGHVNFAVVIETLSKIGYNKYLSAEILPLPDPDTAAVNTIRYMRGLLSNPHQEMRR